jgi:hypothetical protein
MIPPPGLLDRGGMDALKARPPAFRARLTKEDDANSPPYRQLLGP